MRYLRLVNLTIACLYFMNFCFADEVVQASANGGINWSAGTVFAHGYGVAPEEYAGTGKARLLARRAAQLDAYRNLAEIVDGVRVNSQTRVQELMLASDTVRTQVESVIKGALMVKDHYQNEVATVTMQIPIAGNLMSALIPEKTQLNSAGLSLSQFEIIQHKTQSTWHKILNSPIYQNLPLNFFNQAHAETMQPHVLVISTSDEAEFSKKMLIWLEQQNAGKSVELLKKSIEAYEKTSDFTGLLIDASAVSDFQIAAVPTIRSENGDIIYPTDDTSYGDLVKKRPVSYDFDVRDAIQNVRVAVKPMIIKASRTYKSRKSDLVISQKDADILSQNKTINQVMNTAGVMVVVAE